MPQFPGGMNELLTFIAKNLKYPTQSQLSGIEGKVIIRFIVCTDGYVRGAKVLRAVSPELDKEALRVVRALPRWIPGKKDGKAVPVYYTCPIVFRLTGNGKQDDKEHFSRQYNHNTLNSDDSDEYQLAQFPGGKEGLKDFIHEHLEFPQSSINQGVSGEVIATFLVGKDGMLKDIKIRKSLSPLCNKAVINALKKMPRWTPATYNGQAISSAQLFKVYFNSDDGIMHYNFQRWE